MKISSVLMAIAMTGFIYSCGNKTENHSEDGNHEMEMAETLDVKIDNKIDPVCGMEMKEGMIRDTIHLNENTFGFCSKNCKETFAKKPEEFLDKMQ